MATESNLVPVTIVYRCGHTSDLMAIAGAVDALRASMGSWRCTACTLSGPQKVYGRGRGSARVPLVRYA